MQSSQDELIQKILQLNSPETPYVIESVGQTIVATWNLVDVKWIKLFGLAGMKKAYTFTLSFNADTHQISYNEQSGEVTWQAGVPTVSYAVNTMQGKQKSFSFGVKYGVKPDLTVGEIYKFDFSTKKIKDPILKVVTENGWTIKRSLLERLLGV